MDTGTFQNKLKLLFEKIVEPQYVLNNYYADSLLNKLKSKDPEISNLERVPFLPDLLLDALQHVDAADVTVKVFVTRMLAIVVQSEPYFTKIFAQEGDRISKAFANINERESLPSTRVAYLEVALSLTAHDSGTSWLYENDVWKSIVNLCFSNQTVFVFRQAYKFIADFLWKLSDREQEERLTVVLECILDPVLKNPYHKLDSLSREEEHDLSKLFEPTLHMLLTVLSYNVKVQQKNSLVKQLTMNNYNLSMRLYSILSLTRREEAMHLLTKLIFVLSLAKVFVTKPMQGSDYQKEDFLELTVSYFNTVRYFVKRRLVVPLMDYCNTCCIIWSECWSKSAGPTFEKNGKTFELQSQLMFILLVPILMYIKGHCKADHTFNQDDPLSQYITKLLTSSCEHTARAAYSIRNLMYDSDPLAMALHCVKRLSCLTNHLNNHGANLIFQALFYVLTNYVPLDKNKKFVEDEDVEESAQKALVMTYVIDTIYRLVKEYDINWHQSLETVCLYNQVHHILQRRNLSCKFVVAALNLIKITVQKFLPPSLSLLMESKPDSAIHELGKLIYYKLHDPNWEIRDSALELLLSCIQISFIKYTPFQTQIKDDKLISVAAAIALNDSESYVQASALKCLGAASKVTVIWEQLVQEHPDVLEKLISQLCNNPEGIVRKEVVVVLCEIYQNLKLQPSFKSRLYEHMVSTAISDFHWEVQITAMQFWRVVIKSLLADQGMLDGNFPPVTFSKETRKIVTLNQFEIQKRVRKTFGDLANMGCLTVLVKLLNEESEVEIMETALNISMELSGILQEHKITSMQSSTEGDNKLTDDFVAVVLIETDSENHNGYVDEDSPTRSDSIIDGILKANDMNLLSNIYESHMKLQNESPKENVNVPKVKFQRYVSPSSFLKYLNDTDFKSILEEKRKWKEGIRSVSSLLDDILGIYDCSDEVNDMDCY